MSTAKRCLLRDHKPLLQMSDSELAEFQRNAGMYPPAEDCRDGVAALSLRREVSLRDAMETMDVTLQQLAGVLSMMSLDESLETRHAAVAWSCESAVRQLRGLHALVFAGVLHPAAVVVADQDSK